MENKDYELEINNLLNAYFEYSNEIPIILVSSKVYIKLRDKYKIDFKIGINTYKGYYIVFKKNMPKNTNIIVMSVKDYERNSIEEKTIHNFEEFINNIGVNNE